MSKSRGTWHRRERGRRITALMARDGTACTICGSLLDRKIEAVGSRHPPDYITFDHVVPRSAGGLTDLSNLRLAHHRCNRARGNDPVDPATESEQ